MFWKLQLVYFESQRACRLLSQFPDPRNARLTPLLSNQLTEVFKLYICILAFQLCDPAADLAKKWRIADVNWHPGSVRVLFGYIHSWSTQ